HESDPATGAAEGDQAPARRQGRRAAASEALAVRAVERTRRDEPMATGARSDSAGRKGDPAVVGRPTGCRVAAYGSGVEKLRRCRRGEVPNVDRPGRLREASEVRELGAVV